MEQPINLTVKRYSMQKITLFLVANLLAMAAGAQLMDMQTQLYFTRLTTNPALTAYNGSTNVHGFFRDQWSGVANHPRIGGAIGEISLWKDRIGTGVEVMAYSAGVSKIIDAKLYYAQKVKLAPNHQLSIGVAAGILQHNTNYDANRVTELVGDPNFNQPANMLFDLNIGLAYQWKNLTLGFAIPNLLDGNTRVYNNQTKLSGFNRTYVVNGSYEINLAKGRFNLEPLVVFNVNQNKAFNMKMQVMADYKKIVFLGAGYNLYGGVPITAGVRISKIFTLAYGYQVPVMRNIPTTGIYSTHEVMMSVCFDKWVKKADNPKTANAAMAPQQSAYDSLLARQAAADSLAVSQKAAVEDLTQKVNALQQALANAGQQNSENAAQKKEQEEKLEVLNKQIEAQQKQLAETKAKEEAAKAAATQQQAKEKEAAAAEQQAKEKAEAAKAAAAVEQQAKAKQEAEKAAAEQKAKAKEETTPAAPLAKTETKPTTQGYEIIAEAPALPAQSETKAAPQVGERFSLGNISVERDGSKLNPEAYAELDKLVNYLKLHKDIRVRIVGHGDGYDMEEQSGFRSYKRARRVAEYLETKGIPLTQFTYVGMGPRKPIADNSTEEGRAKNFRIEIEIIK